MASQVWFTAVGHREKQKMQTTKLQHVIDILRSLDADIPISVIVTFLSLSDGEEIEVRDLQQKVDISVSALNRALTYLGDSHWSKSSKKGGLGLVVQRISPEDRRVRIAQLTPKGQRVINLIEGALSS